MGKKIAIIGAGASGLPCLRHVSRPKENAPVFSHALLYGLDAVCFEATGDIGGLWHFKAGDTEYSTVMKSTVINTSKEMTAYSDFPPPPHAANYMHNKHLLQYFEEYTDHFDLRRHIRFHTKVNGIKRAKDYQQTGRWDVTFTDDKNVTKTETFDGVLLCNGHHAEPSWPKPWPGQDKFKGKLLHSHDYKDHKGVIFVLGNSLSGFEDKVVVCVGVGNSGVDVNVELSRVAEQVYMSTRRGTWVMNRVAEYGAPWDAGYSTRANMALFKLIPLPILDTLDERKLNKRFDHELYGLKPKHHLRSAHPTLNDELPNRIISGTVRVKPNIREFTETGVIFDDGSRVDNVDAVIFSTGYKFGFPLMEEGKLLPVHNNRVTAYKYMYPLETADHNTLAIIGLIQPLGSIMPISEMQGRVFCDVLSGRTKLPSKTEMEADVQAKREALAKRYVDVPRHTIQVDYMPFMDELADMIGVKPNLAKLALTDPVCRFSHADAVQVLAKAVVFDPAAAYQYRIHGPHPWSGAREAILTTNERIRRATSDKPLSSHSSSLLSIFVVTLALLLAYFVFHR